MAELLSIRPAVPTDESVLLGFISAIQDAECAIHDSRLPGHITAAAYLRSLISKTPTILIAVADATPVGFVSGWIDFDDDDMQKRSWRRHGWISDLYVVAAFQKRGVAQMLLGAIRDALAARGAYRLRICSLASNEPALAAYRRFGFRPFETDFEASIGPVLRRATASDADVIGTVTDAAYAKWVPILGRKPAPMLVDYAVAVRDHLIDVLESAGAIIALIELVPEPDCLVVENIAVLPAHAGRGYGRRLMAHAESVAADYRLGRVRLYTNRNMSSNIALYEQLGFAIDREEHKDDGRTIVHMSRAVTTTR